MEHAAYANYVDHAGVRPEPMTEDFSPLIGDERVWVAEHEGAVMGLLVLTTRPDHLLLDSIAVSPDAQGMGIGRRLLEFVEEHARAHGLGEVRLYTDEAMTSNIDYYLRRGFVETRRAVDQGRRRVFFTKHLG